MENQRTELNRYLREATKEAHRRLDHHPILTKLLRTDLTRIAYGEALAALHSVFLPMEEGVIAFLANKNLSFDYRQRRKIPLLEADLADLYRLPWSQSMVFDPPRSNAELLAALYLLEGTTQGGVHILACIEKSGFADWPRRYVSGYGQDNSAQWQEFWAFAALLCDEEDYPAVALRAVSLFQSIGGHFDRGQS